MSMAPMTAETYRRAATILAGRWGMSPRTVMDDTRRKQAVRTRWRLWATMRAAGYSGASIADARGYDPSTVNGTGPSGVRPDPDDVHALQVALSASPRSTADVAAALADVEAALRHLSTLRDRLVSVLEAV